MFFNDTVSNGIHINCASMEAIGGFKATLSLYYPNTHNIKSVKDVEFFKKFENFQYRQVSPDTIAQLLYLSGEIKHYCEYNMFITFEGKPALKLTVYDHR